ncbi:Uma2 family endonuclease [Leptolyngbya cf. ectocarpi LEGE 11479]|uniref:Uma2 family endonuclease n=2 Tax=Leptolyngbya ectocarpi TaxID=1202 RepID=A0A928X167_LEPEC|nr:Uma2 family endonuclease [Leptolyngbya cf. ectocarpi LEGE 11479]
MVQTVSAPYFTLEQYLAHTADTDIRCELVNGTLVEMPPESDENLSIARRLLLELIRYFPADQVTWGTEIEVSGQRVSCRIPDLLVHSEGSKAAISGMKRATITHDMPPPLLVVEVVSPGQTNRDRDYRYKHTEYMARCIAEYWIIDPELRQVTVCRWDNGLYEDMIFAADEPLKSSLVPDFSLSPSQILGS